MTILLYLIMSFNVSFTACKRNDAQLEYDGGILRTPVTKMGFPFDLGPFEERDEGVLSAGGRKRAGCLRCFFISSNVYSYLI